MKQITLMTVFLLMALLGCALPQAVSTSDAKESMTKFTYARDERSGLCFAFLSSMSYNAYNVISFTEIPCEKMPQKK